MCRCWLLEGVCAVPTTKREHPESCTSPTDGPRERIEASSSFATLPNFFQASCGMRSLLPGVVVAAYSSVATLPQLVVMNEMEWRRRQQELAANGGQPPIETPDAPPRDKRNKGADIDDIDFFQAVSCMRPLRRPRSAAAPPRTHRPYSLTPLHTPKHTLVPRRREASSSRARVFATRQESPLPYSSPRRGCKRQSPSLAAFHPPRRSWLCATPSVSPPTRA